MNRGAADAGVGSTRPPAASLITNRWGEVPLTSLDVEHVAVFDGHEGAAFNHQAQPEVVGPIGLVV